MRVIARQLIYSSDGREHDCKASLCNFGMLHKLHFWLNMVYLVLLGDLNMVRTEHVTLWAQRAAHSVQPTACRHSQAPSLQLYYPPFI